MSYLEYIESITKDNKYTKWYLNIMRRALERATSKKQVNQLDIGYVEAHHIVPKSIAPNKAKDKNNIVYLTGREHFVAHLLLVRMMTSKEHRIFMGSAVGSMTWSTSKHNHGERYRLTSWEFAIARKIAAIASSEREKRPVIINGVFHDSVTAAAEAFNIDKSTVVSRCKQKNTGWHTWRYSDEPEKIYKPIYTKPVIVDGINYKSVESVKRKFNITRSEADARLIDLNWPNWKYIDESVSSYSRITRTSMCKPVIVNGKYYESIYKCAKELGIDKTTLRGRVNNRHNSKFIDYQWASEQTTNDK